MSDDWEMVGTGSQNTEESAAQPQAPEEKKQGFELVVKHVDGREEVFSDLNRDVSTIFDVKKRLEDNFGHVEHQALVFRGRVLSNEQVLCSIFPSGKSRFKVFLAITKSRAKSPDPISSSPIDEAPPPMDFSDISSPLHLVPPPSGDGDDGSTPTCRICLSSDVSPELGTLFSPCKCAGTMKYIHVNCLTQWRLHSRKTTSYYQCDSCKYQYNLQRPKYAEVLMSESTSKWVSIALLMFAQFLNGVFLYQFNVHTRLYDWIQWSPRSLYYYVNGTYIQSIVDIFITYFAFLSPALDMFICGSLVTCAVGLSSYCLNMHGRHIRLQNWWVGVAFFVVQLVYMHGTKALRLILLIGIGHAFLTILHIIKQKTKDLLAKWGEKVLDISENSDPRNEIHPHSD